MPSPLEEPLLSPEERTTTPPPPAPFPKGVFPLSSKQEGATPLPVEAPTRDAHRSCYHALREFFLRWLVGVLVFNAVVLILMFIFSIFALEGMIVKDLCVRGGTPPEKCSYSRAAMWGN